MSNRVKERVEIVSLDNTVTNKDMKPVAYGYKLKLNEQGNPSMRNDGVYAMDYVGGILCGETGYITGDAIRTLFGFLKETGGDSAHRSLSQQETTYVIPVFLDRYQTEVYVHTSNIKFI